MAKVVLNFKNIFLLHILTGTIFQICEAKSPNIVFILTDDQDVALLGQYPMPKTKQLIADAGMTFTNMFVSSPICCPSRSSILTGQFVHNHMVTNNSLSGNCSSTSWQNSAERKTFPIFLQANHYKTFFAGKYLNEYGSPQAGGVSHVPLGWDDWNGLVGNSVYYNYTLSVQGKEEKHGDNYEADYFTDIIHRKAIDFLSSASSRQSFFMMLSTPACHQPFTSAPQYMKNFTDQRAPRTKHFNIHGQDKHWLVEQTITPMPNDTVAMIDDFFRNRLRTLLSVDDMVEGVVNKLKEMGELDNTYIFFTSDNGYHLGQFSLPYDKRQPYDFDIQVPLMVRGPGIKPNTTSEELIMTVDLAPTFLNIGKASQSVVDSFDGMTFLSLLSVKEPIEENIKPSNSGSGEPLKFIEESTVDKRPLGYKCTSWNTETSSCKAWSVKKRSKRSSNTFRSSILVEYFGEHENHIPGCPQYEYQGLSECDAHCVCRDGWNNTYGCIRYETQQESYKYCAMQDNDNFVEVYDLRADPFELTNLAKTASPDLLTKLSQDLADLSLCAGETCHKKSSSYFKVN